MRILEKMRIAELRKLLSCGCKECRKDRRNELRRKRWEEELKKLEEELGIS